MTKPLDLVGQTFARLRVLKRLRSSPDGRTRFAALCQCGKVIAASGKDIRTGHTRSCGCLQQENRLTCRRTHGETRPGTSEFGIWKTMIQRCENPAVEGYRNYGARGIKVCERWRNSYQAFLADMGRRPSRRHSIDRIENDGNYEPGNCRWATRFLQNTNRRRTATHYLPLALQD